MSETSYDEKYFAWYAQKGRFTRRAYGDKTVFLYWASYLRRHLVPGARVLEVGCGLGFFGARLVPHFAYVGMDISEEALAWARAHHDLPELLHVDAQQPLPADDGSFAAVVAFDVIEHLADPQDFLEEVHRLLRPGGLFIATTPNTHSLGVRLKSNTPGLVPSMYKDDTHISLLPPEQWRALLSGTGFELVRTGTDGIWDVPYVTFLPARLQFALLYPFNQLISVCLGMLPWTIGENFIFIAKKPDSVGVR